MDHDPNPESQEGGRPQGPNPFAPPPPPPRQPTQTPPPPPPHGAAYAWPGYGQYGPPPPPPRQPKPMIWRIFSFLVGLFLVFIVLMLILGLVSGLVSGRDGFVGYGDKLGLLRIEGTIGQTEEKRFWIESLRELGRNDHIKGIVVRIDSPGGTVGASQELYQTIKKIAAKKPVYVSMGDLAASGGYYTASAASRIYANKGTLTGSIGVIFSRPEVAELTKKLGIQFDNITSGQMKDAGDMFRPMTPQEREYFQTLIMNTYGQFTSDILAVRQGPIDQARGRMTPELWKDYKITPPAEATAEGYLKQLADGRVYTGEQALQLGLVDEIGTLEDAEEALAKKVGLRGKPTVIEMTRRAGVGDLFRTQVGNLLPSGRSPLQYLMKMP